MNLILTLTQIIVAVTLIVVVLLQQKNTGFTSAFGGGSEFYTTRRGMEKVLFVSTIILGITFVGVSLLNSLYF